MNATLSRLRTMNPAWWRIGLLVVAVLLPLPLGDYYRSVLWRTGLYVMLGLSLNIIVGYAGLFQLCILYTSDAADDLLCVDLGGRRIIKKKKTTPLNIHTIINTMSLILLEYNYLYAILCKLVNYLFTFHLFLYTTPV